MCAVKHTQLLANHNSGCLLLSLQSATPIQTERSDEWGQKQDKLFLLLNYIFYVKILITSGPQRTVKIIQNAAHGPCKDELCLLHKFFKLYVV